MKKSTPTAAASSKSRASVRPTRAPKPPAALDETMHLQLQQRILQSRAVALAQVQHAGDAPQEQIEILEFVLAHENYALETAWVREVCPLKTLTPLPCVPAFVMGIVNIRGRLVSVIDLKRFFSLPDQGLTDLNKIIVLQNNGMEFAVLADLLVGVRRLPVSCLQAGDPILSDARQAYLKGVTAERLIVLDGKQLLSDPRIVVDEEVVP